MRALRVEPGVDVAFTETPLSADTNRRDFSSFDEAIYGAEVDLEVFQDLFRREKYFVGWQMQGQDWTESNLTTEGQTTYVV